MELSISRMSCLLYVLSQMYTKSFIEGYPYTSSNLKAINRDETPKSWSF